MTAVGRLTVLARLSFSLILLCTLATPGAAQPSFEERLFRSPVVELNYVDVGSGPAVVLLHGDSGNWRQWAQNGVLPDLARDHRVIAVDQRGRGKSSKFYDPAAYDETMGDDVVRLLDHLGIRRAHVFGYSMGAHTTVELLTRHPERVITAIIGGAPGRISVTEAVRANFELEASEREKDCVSRRQYARLNKTDVPIPDSVFLAARAACYANPLIDSKALAASSRGTLRHPRTEAMIRGIRDVPILGVIGSGDPYVPDFAKFASWNSALKVITIAGGTHDSVFLQSAPMLAAARTWLAVYRDRP